MPAYVGKHIEGMLQMVVWCVEVVKVLQSKP
jgi:hypothetical protein